MHYLLLPDSLTNYNTCEIIDIIYVYYVICYIQIDRYTYIYIMYKQPNSSSSDQYFPVLVQHDVFIHFLYGRILNFFQPLILINKSIMNIIFKRLLQTQVFNLLGKYLGVGLFRFLRNQKLVSINVSHFMFPHALYKSSGCSA